MGWLFGIIVGALVFGYFITKDLLNVVSQIKKKTDTVDDLSDDLYDIKKYLRLDCTVKTKRMQNSEVHRYIRRAFWRGMSVDEIVEGLKGANQGLRLHMKDDHCDFDFGFVDINITEVGLLDIEYFRKVAQRMEEQEARFQEEAISEGGLPARNFSGPSSTMGIQEFLEAISDDLYDIKKHLGLRADIRTRTQQLKTLAHIITNDRHNGVSVEQIISKLEKANLEGFIKDIDGWSVNLETKQFGPIDIDYHQR